VNGIAREEIMKRAIIAILAIVIVWWEFQDDLAYWPPAWGTALDSGYVWGEVVILGALARQFGSVVSLSYRFLN
jgi:hypothetical protein